eukprot:12413355-Karenia_brevis.AAC.1
MECQEEECVNQPEEEHEEGFCALLQKSMHGTQDASAIWQDDYCKLLLDAGFKRSVGKAAISFTKLNIRVLVH